MGENNAKVLIQKQHLLYTLKFGKCSLTRSHCQVSHANEHETN